MFLHTTVLFEAAKQFSDACVFGQGNLFRGPMNQVTDSENIPQLRLSYCPMPAPIPMHMSTPPFINPWRTCAARVTVLVLCVCVCVSVTQHLTLNVIIHATNDSNLPSGG